MARLQSFSLSAKEKTGVELAEEDVFVDLNQAERSLIGKIFGDKRANLVVGVRNTMMKLWHNRGLCKVVALDQNVFQFVFKDALDREGILQGRLWLFENQIMVIQPQKKGQRWKQDRLNISPIWVQVQNIPSHWMLIETGKKIGALIGSVRDVMLVEARGREDRHVKVLVEMDLTKPLIRGTTLKYKQAECQIEFRYEQLPLFCFYYGMVGHNEKLCSQSRKDVDQNCAKTAQYGLWLRAGVRSTYGGGLKLERMASGEREQT